MNKYLSIILTAASCIACTKEVVCPEETPVDLKEICFTASGGNRTSLFGMTILWSRGDEASVFDGDGNRCFTALNSGSVTELKGNAVESEFYSFLYPYNASATIDGDAVSTTLPHAQSAVAGSFDPKANISVGRSGTGKVTMRNAGALLRLTIPSNSYDIRSVTVESLNGAPLSGSVTINGITEIPVMTANEGSISSVSIASEQGICPGTYYICTIPAVCSGGLKVSLGLSGGEVLYKQNTAKATLTRNSILDLGTLKLDKFTYLTDTPDDGSADPVSEYASYGVDFSKLKAQGHPRLMLNASDFEGMKARVAAADPDDNFYMFHEQVMKRSLKVSRKTATLEYFIDENGNLLDVSNEALERLFSCSYLYRVTGDESALERARKDLFDVCNFKDWNPEDMMSVAEMTTGVAIAYDWLHDRLTYKEKEMVENALYEKSLVPFSKYKPREDSNWNQSTTGGAILTAIVLYEKHKALCAATLDKCIKSNKNAVYNIFYPYGSGKEGPGYSGYTITYEGLSLQALRTAFGTCCDIEKIEGLEKNGEWCLFMDGPVGTFNFSDASPEELGEQLACAFIGSFYNRPDILLRERAVISKVATYSTNRFLPAAAVWAFRNPTSDDVPAFPTKRVWSCNGECPLVLARIGWNYNELDKYVAVKAASGHNSHSHLDGGEFVYDAFGYRWSSDIKMGKYAGYKNDIYAIDGSSLFTYKKQTSLRWDILCQNNYFHSTLAFTWSDGSIEKLHTTDQITDKACSVVSTFDDPSGEGCGGTIDISDHYSDAASKVLRTVNLKGSTLHVTDEIKSLQGHAAPFEWRMVTVADATVDTGGRYVKLVQGSKALYLYCIAEGDVSKMPMYAVEQNIVRPQSWTPRGWDGYQSYEEYHVVKFSAEVASGLKTGIFRTVISQTKP